MRRACVSLIVILVFLVTIVGEPQDASQNASLTNSPYLSNPYSPSNWEDMNSGTGLPLSGTISGSKTSYAASVIDSTHAAYLGTSSPLGWSSEELEMQLDHLSKWVDAGLVNPSLDAYHEEHWFMAANPEYNYDPFYVPDGWTLVKNDATPSGTQHPQHGYFEINSYSGNGYDGTQGWRFDGNLDSSATVNPTTGFYMSQQVSTSWRSIYSAEISFYYYVSSTSTLNDEVFIFTSLEGYVSKYHVFDSGTPFDTWFRASATVPSTYFDSLQGLDSLLFNIGLGTDIDGNPSTADHEVYIDEITLTLNVRPFPEDIDLRANGALVTGSTKGSVSPYVPDSANRDCYSAPNSNGGSGGVDLNGYSNDGALEVGADVPSYPDWSNAYSYQVGLQFPLNVPQGAAIESAILEVEAVTSSIGYPGMRIFVADEDNVAAFTSGNPQLPDRYGWINTSIYWRPMTWSANGRYQTPDLSGLIQEVVSRSGWQSGNYICVMIGYAYSNQQYAYSAVKGSSNYLQGDLARLFVDFIEPASGDSIPSFKYSKTITIDHTKVVSDLRNFPILVDIWDKDLHFNTQPDGDDIAFLYNGQVIPHELELFDKKGNGTHAHLTCWVNVPYLSSVEDTSLVMVYGDDAIGSQENPNAVWDSGFSAVWHLNDNPAQPQWQSSYADYLPHQPQIQDSSLNGLDGTTYGTMTTSDSVDGQIGSAIDLDGANDYVDFGNPQDLQMTGSFTVEAWFKADFIDNDYLVVKSGETNYRGWDLSFDDDPSMSPAGWVMFRYSPDGVNTNIVGYERVDTGQWYHVVGVFCPSFYARFYLNGELVEEATTGIPASMNSPSRPVRIGRRSDDAGGTTYMDAIVDEVRISSVARSDAWIKTEYNNQRNPELFLTVGESIANFRYSKNIAVDHTKVASNLTGFPVLINIYDSDLKTNVQADGDDIMFASNGRNLPFEIELFDQQYNSTHAHLIAWVKTDLSSITDTILTMYYSNPSIGAQENPSEVWGADYAGVWHLGESSGNAIDSTYFGKSGSVSAGVTRNQQGIAGSCYEFNGVSGNVNFGDPSDSHLDFGANSFSYSFWVRIDQSTSNYQLPLFKGGTTTSDAGYEIETNTAGSDLKAEVADGVTQVISGSTPVTFGQWMYLVVVVDVSVGLLRFYRNGAQVGTPQSISSLGSVSNSQSFQISPLSYPIDGAVDEVRLTDDILGAGWILTEYNNQLNPTSFYSLGIEQEVVVPREVPLDFTYKKDFTIDHTKVTSDLYGFPVLIDLYDKDLRFDVQEDGSDIVFVQDGWILSYEIEKFEQSYNSTHAHLISWVRVDLSASADTVLSMYYGNPSSDSLEDPQGVWDTSFAAVWHLNEDPATTVYDSTANNNDGIGLSVSSGPTLQRGKIDGCTEFYGETTKDRVEAPHSSSLVLQSNMLVEAWVKTSNVDGTSDVIVAKWGAVGQRNYWLGKLDGSILAFYVDNTQSVTASLSLVNDGNWHHVVGVANAASGNLFLYVDGIQRGSASYSGTSQTGTSVIQIANNPNTAFIQEWDGRIDEVRVSSSYRSPEWIQTEYNNQNDPAGFISVGSEKSSAPLDFAYKKDITINHMMVDENLTDFPMLVDIFDTDLRTDVQADGDDIMFKSGDYWCPHEISLFDQTYNETHAHLIAWVKTDLSASVDTIITMYYGNPDMTSQQCPSAVWGDYAGVWHLDESPTGTVYDSSPYNNDGTTVGSMTGSDLVLGQVGSGFELDGNDDMIRVFESPSLDSIKYAGTLSIWINWLNSSNGLWQRILTTTDRFDPPNDGFEWAVQNDGDLYFYPWGGGSGDYNLVTDPCTDGIWQYLVVTLDYSTKSVKFYLDGNSLSLTIEQVPSLWTQLASLDDWLWGGNDIITTGQFQGKFDEIRATNVVRSLGWISTEYNNQYSPNTFYSIDPEEQIGDKEIVFATDSESSVTIGVQLSLGVQTPIYTYADDFTLGTSFSAVNGSLPIWTAGALVSPPSELDEVSFEISYPDGEWWPFSVTSPLGIEKAFATDWTCFDGRLIVDSSAIDEFGMWQIQFLDRNHILDTQMGPAGGPYTTTDQFSIGEDINFRVWSSGTMGSTISLELTDPSGSTWYTGSTTFQGERFTLPYYHRKQLTISHDNVVEDLVNFPVLVDIYDTDLRTDVRSDGRDIAFAIGETTLSHEIETFDQTYNLTHAHLVAWVNVPLLSGSMDTIIAMYYGNPLAPIVYDSGPVWDSGYLGVWHLSESGTGALEEYKDSSQYKNNGQGGDGNISYVPTQVTGKIGSGQDFNNLTGHYDFIDCGDSPLWQIDGYQITLEAWIQHDITPNTHVYGIMNHKGWYDGYALYINYGGGSTIKPTFALTAQDGYQLVGADDVTGGTWHQIVATYDGSLMRIFVDGIQDPNVLVKTNAIEPSSYEKDFWIGHGDQPQDKAWSSEWDGQIDEVRVSDVVRSAGWIQTQFDNQYAPTSFYSVSGEESIGYSESTIINMDTSVSAGIWHVTARYSDDSSGVSYRVGMITRSFIVMRGVTLNLIAPGDAVSDGISSKLIGEQLHVEYELADTLTSALVSGATITMNWSIGGVPTNVQLNDYGDGRYGRTLNTSDLGDYGRWRIDLGTDHPFYADSSSFFYLDIYHRTFITYDLPSDIPYGDDFQVRVTLRDQFNGALLPGASISSNGTIVGTPVDYGNGTYLVTIDSIGLSTGSHAFSLMAIPSTTFLSSSQVDVRFTYRPISTDGYLVGSGTAETPWNQQSAVTLHWFDTDHLGVGIEGGTISINPLVQSVTLDIGGGYYNLTIDVGSYSVGSYVFDLTISKTNYQQTFVTLTIVIGPHKTSIDIDYESTIPVGSDSSFSLQFMDVDLGATAIDSGNLSSILVDWGSGFQEFYSYSFVLDTSGWIVGSYTINLTVIASSIPRYYLDKYILINLEIRRLGVYLSWDHLEPFPNGNDFVMYLHVNVSEPGQPTDGSAVDWLDQSYFIATNQTGAVYSVKSFLNLGDGLYELTIDGAVFFEGQYGIIVYVDFLTSENFADAHTPTILFIYRPILTYLTSSDYPTVSTSYDTNVTITLSYIDIDHGLNISTGAITSQGTSIEWHYVADGVYEALIIVRSWDLGVHEVNITADATGYQAKTLTFQVLVQIAYAYARSSESTLDLPVGDTAIFYVDYWDITHDEPIIGATASHDWLHVLTVSWTGLQYRIELPSLDTDSLGTYLVMFNFSKGQNYQFGYFNLTIILRTHSTEFRLANAVEPTSHNAVVNVSVYCGDLDNDVGIVSSFISLSIYNQSGQIPSTFENDTALGNGYFIIRIAASNLGISGVYELAIHFNWTGPISKFYNRTLRAFVNIVGEASELELLESSGPTPYMENMSYTYLYSELYSGIGISNTTPPAGNVFVYIRFLGEIIDYSQVSIIEVIGQPGHYTIEFNSTMFGRPGIFTMLVFVNWSKTVDPFYTNRTDTVTVRITPRSTAVTVTPPESTPYGVNATFAFSFDDVVGGTPNSVALSSQMTVIIGLPDYTLIYNTSTRQFQISFNTSILGPPLGNRQFAISISWTGSPYYANITGRAVIINIRYRDTEFDCSSINPTPYGNNITLRMTFNDVTLGTSDPINDGLITLYNASQIIPASDYHILFIGNGVYELELNTTCFGAPGTYQLTLEINTPHFYYAIASTTRALSLRYRLTMLVAEPIGETPFNSSLTVVFQYTDILTSLQIGNGSTQTTLEILNGSSWLFFSSWRSASQDYLLTIETYNQNLEINREYVLWLRISYPDASPFYKETEAFVSFTLRERMTFLDLVQAPLPAQYLDYINLTVLYGDLESSRGIAGAVIALSLNGSNLIEGEDYQLQMATDGLYYLTINTTSVGPAGTSASLLLVASWTLGTPYYTNSAVTLSLSVTGRSAYAEMLKSPTQVIYLNNITFTFRYIDGSTEDLILLTKSQVFIYSGGSLLLSNYFSMSFVGSGYEISINSTILSSNLISNWNITIRVDWQDGLAPYYTDDSVTAYATVTNRVGLIIRDPVPTTPIGDNISIGFAYVDAVSSAEISGAIVVFDCLSPSGLVENTHFWVIKEGGYYTILVNSSYFGSTGTYTFALRLLWSRTLIPYYANTSLILLQGSIRQIQALLESSEPTPSTVPINENVSVTLTFSDLDHGVPINGAEVAFSVVYKTNSSGPGLWTITPAGPGEYLLVVDCSDAGSTGTNTLIIVISFSDYQTAEIQVPFQIRDRQGELSELPPSDTYFGESTFVEVQLIDTDAANTPIDDALLSLSWPGIDAPLWSPLGNGWYRINLTTNGLNSGIHILLIGAQKSDYFIPDISVSIQILRIPTAIILPSALPDVYWGEDISLWAIFNDTRNGGFLSGAAVIYQFGVLNGLLSEGLPAGNYSTTVATGILPAATSYIVTITASLDNYATTTKQVTVNVLRIPLGLSVLGNVHPSLFKGDQLNITVYVNNTYYNAPLLGAIVTASTTQDLLDITLAPVAGMSGYYFALVDTSIFIVGDYIISISASRINYVTASTSINVEIDQIPTVVNLDVFTSTYSSQSFNWSDTIRLGVYVLVPSLNESYPYSTGLSDCVVTWSISGTSYTGQFENGTPIGGAGFYYFDFDTMLFESTTYTLRITAHPNTGMFAYSTNTTILKINPVATSVESTYVGTKIWGWTGWVNLTYWDLLHNSGVHYADIQVDWEGVETIYNYLGAGIYEVFINTSLVKPGVYPVSVNFQQENYEGATGVFTLTVQEVPTDIEVYTASINQIEDDNLNLQVPYGDILPIILFYNDTWYCRGIPGATEMAAVIIGPSIPDKEILTIEELAFGNYSLMFDSTNWIVSATPYRIILSLSLDNWSRATLSIDITIINVPSLLEVMGENQITMNYGQQYTAWVFYSDIWEGHNGEGIPGGTINATSWNKNFVIISFNQSDPTRPGWYEIRLVSQRAQGSALVTIEIKRENFSPAMVSIAVRVEPSDFDMLIETAIIYGVPVGLILLLGAALWTRLFSVPKLLRHIKKMVKDTSKGKIPKPPEEAKTRQQIVAQLYNEITGVIGITKTAEQMPLVPVTTNVPEIDSLLIQLSVLTRLSPDELDDFKVDLSKMKLSEQVNFVKEVINQEAIKRARSERKTMEIVLEETAAQARSLLAGEEPEKVAEAPMPEESIEPPEMSEVEEAKAEIAEPEEDILVDVLSDDEIEEIRKKLIKAGINKNELRTIIDQVRELPRNLVDELLKSVLGEGGE